MRCSPNFVKSLQNITSLIFKQKYFCGRHFVTCNLDFGRNTRGFYPEPTNNNQMKTIPWDASEEHKWKHKNSFSAILTRTQRFFYFFHNCKLLSLFCKNPVFTRKFKHDHTNTHKFSPLQFSNTSHTHTFPSLTRKKIKTNKFFSIQHIKIVK